MKKDNRKFNPRHRVSHTTDKPSTSPNKARSSFQRGQTISGYNKETSERNQHHELITQRRKLGTFFAFIAGAAVFILFILIQLTVNVVVYSSQSQKIPDQQRYVDVIQGYYEDHPIERLKMFLNGDKLLEEIQAKLPEVSKINNIKPSGITESEFILEMRQPVAIWDFSDDKKYFVDSAGVAFQENFFDRPVVSVFDESGVRNAKGNVIVSGSFLSFIGKTIGAAQSHNIKIEKITIPPASLRQIEVYIEGRQYPVKFLTSRSPEGQVSDLNNTLAHLDKYGIVPQCIDLRVEGKAFYK